MIPPDSENDRNRHFNLSLDMLCIAGIDGYFKQVNPSWTRILGWSETELLSRPVVEFIHPDDRERTLLARANLTMGVVVSGLENRYLCKDGTHRWLSWQASMEPGGATVFGVARDITERRQLDHDQLIMSKLESTGVLAGGIAHDFNNLLTGLMLNMEMVRMTGSINHEQEIFLHQAQQSAHAAQVLAQQLIIFAHGESSVRKPTDLERSLRESVEVALCGSNLRSEIRLAPDLWPAVVDENQFAVVIRNVVLNAREAMPTGGTIRLQADNLGSSRRLALGLQPGSYIQISVTDEGAGIPPEVLPKIFDPYFSTKERGSQKGMGLGLTICHSVVKKHGGLISVDPLPGRGTAVLIYLPAAPKRQTESAPLVAASAPDQTEAGTF